MIKVKMQIAINTVKLAVKLAEELAPRYIMPIIKNNEIILDDSLVKDSLSIEEVLPHIRVGLEEAKIKYRRIYVRDDEIYVEDEGSGGGVLSEPPLLFCPFCGYSTEYEEVYWIHVKSHGII
ncbi:MAG: hypothetical protein NZ929_07315 [Aigarchaeota archaeon]|nr:hypothetical protein [Aigarchaeota archaeon]MCX8193166.1 hypothetical protein [Nitrososphaeria archaeon]MDW7986307.1 hypothetical protein [Nitrososphaerota archaeon]